MSAVQVAAAIRKSIKIVNQFIKANKLAGVDVPVVLLGDSEFRFSTNLMKPNPFCVSAPEQQKAFNYALSRASRVVENAFGQLKARRIGKGFDNRCEKNTNIVMPCCILHNFFNCENRDILDEWKELESIRAQPEHTNATNDFNGTAESIRQAITTFIAETQ